MQLVVAITRVLSVHGQTVASLHHDKWMNTAFVDSTALSTDEVNLVS